MFDERWSREYKESADYAYQPDPLLMSVEPISECIQSIGVSGHLTTTYWAGVAPATIAPMRNAFSAVLMPAWQHQRLACTAYEADTALGGARCMHNAVFEFNP
jgi:hypothetical protein